MNSSKNNFDGFTPRPNDKFGRFLYNLARILALLGGLTLVIVIVIMTLREIHLIQIYTKNLL